MTTKQNTTENPQRRTMPYKYKGRTYQIPLDIPIRMMRLIQEIDVSGPEKAENTDSRVVMNLLLEFWDYVVPQKLRDALDENSESGIIVLAGIFNEWGAKVGLGK